MQAADKLRILVNPAKVKLNVYPLDTTGYGRTNKLQLMVTALFRYERYEANHFVAVEAQGYVERLLQEAIKWGPRHKPTMELMDFWFLEKDMVHRMFKVYVPRFEKFEPPYSKMTFIPTKVPGNDLKRVVLELKGNPYPPVEPRFIDKKNSLANILLSEAKRDYFREKERLLAQKESHQQIASGSDEPSFKTAVIETHPEPSTEAVVKS